MHLESATDLIGTEQICDKDVGDLPILDASSIILFTSGSSRCSYRIYRRQYKRVARSYE